MYIVSFNREPSYIWRLRLFNKQIRGKNDKIVFHTNGVLSEPIFRRCFYFYQVFLLRLLISRPEQSGA